MSTEPTHTEELLNFRDVLVAERRKIVRSVRELRESNRETDPTAGARWGADFKVIQDQIEAVDRAIQDEKKAEPSVFETRGMIA